MAGSGSTGAARVVVIGAGAVGAAVAHALARRGAAVTVVERAQPGGGVSAATFSIDVTPRKTPRAYYDFGLQAREAHRRLAGELGGGTWIHECPRLEWAQEPDDVEQLRQQLTRLREWGHPAETLSAEQAREIEPSLLGNAPAERLWAHLGDCAWYDPPEMVARLLDRARELGASVVCGEQVIGCESDGGRVGACITQSGLRLAADGFVLCAGPQTGEIAGALGSRLPLLQLPGIVGLTAPLVEPPRSIVLSGATGVRPHHGGRALLHSYSVDAALEGGESSPAELAGRLLADASSAVAGLDRVSELRRGVRPLPPDGLPIAGLLEDLENVHVAVTHSGAHLAPLLGELVAQEVLAGVPLAALEPFRPERLSEGGGALLDEAARLMVQRLPDGERARG
jgi:glycine/D-amino acid oxidase-like deaminating enzyme